MPFNLFEVRDRPEVMRQETVSKLLALEMDAKLKISRDEFVS
jgi:hypothetical protein